MMKRWIGSWVMVLVAWSGGLDDATGQAAPVESGEGRLTFRSLPRAGFRFEGLVGERIEVSIRQWWVPAPEANPGMLEMLRLRDRKPAPALVPWAGEFSGKYLISAIEALRMSDDASLESRVREVLEGLMAGQAEDGYLGPFPREQRLTGQWDLWGHYHVLLALLMWHERTGDAAALGSARRAADLVCATFLDGDRRVWDAGSHEMNMAIIHGLGWLYRLTNEPRYLRMMREIERDWERAGDYLRTGLAGVEFFQTPRPRWESLPDLQGLLELYRITGQADYRTAFEHHWRSIVRWDRHNTGGFSTGEQAVGNPYAPGAIETCCTVAWMALSVDMLCLTGDARVADELEWSTYNGGLGAQHPSGRWWTYNTPMDGVREASAHSIVFQARAGTPELNCCSVNAPRVLGMLSEWALLTARDGLVINYYGPARYQVAIDDRRAVELVQDQDYPVTNRARFRVVRAPAEPLTLHFRVPGWSARTGIRLNGAEMTGVRPGRYLSLHRSWKAGDGVELDFDFGLRPMAGDRPCEGKVSLYRGPLLLAYDQKLNDYDEDALPAVALADLDQARVVEGPDQAGPQPGGSWPWVCLELLTAAGPRLRLCDFASAGAYGTRYQSWLPAERMPPPPPIAREPADGATLPAAPFWFKWTTRTNASLRGYRLTLSTSEDFASAVVVEDLGRNRFLPGQSLVDRLQSGTWYYWRVTAQNGHGETDSAGLPCRFRIDPSLPAPARISREDAARPDLLIEADLAGRPEPRVGALEQVEAYGQTAGPDGRAEGALSLDGKDQMVVYRLAEFPEEDYAVSLWFKLLRPPEYRLGQLVSAWARSMDDPLRLVFEDGQLHARVEAGQGYSTAGVAIAPGTWHHVAAVKAGPTLTLYLDGQARGATTIPAYLATTSRALGLGGNPRFSGPEFLPVALADFRCYGRALSEEEIEGLLQRGKGAD